MKTRIVAQADPAAFTLAVDYLTKDCVVAFPTDTVYGIGVRAGSSRAIDRLYRIKGRSFDKPIPVMVGSMDHLGLIVAAIPPAAIRLAERFWPGALTMILPRRDDLPDNLTTLPSVGVRIPDHEFTLALLAQCGPLAVTSANRSGMQEALSAAQVMDQLGGSLELIVDGGPSKGGVASTVVDLTGSDVRILREGPVSEEMINTTLSA